MKKMSCKERKLKLVKFICIGIGSVIGLFLSGAFTSDEAKVNRELAKINEDLPMLIDEATRMDSLSVVGKTLNYFYTCIDLNKEEVDKSAFDQYIAPSILNSIKTSHELEFFKNIDVTFKYLYHDKDGEFFYSYEVTPDMYN